MKNIVHQIDHLYQPTNTSCGPTSLTMLLQFLKQPSSVEEVIDSVPKFIDNKGKDMGTNIAGLARYALHQGYQATIYTYDQQIMNPRWQPLSQQDLCNALLAAKPHRDVPRLGKEWSERYIQSYVNFIDEGGMLVLHDYPRSSDMYELLRKAPFIATVTHSVLFTMPHSRNIGLREVIEDPNSSGAAINHFVVVYGSDKNGNFLVADPWQKPGRFIIEPERLVAAISAAEIECDNSIMQIAPKDT